MGYVLSVFIERPLHFYLSCHVHFLLMTFMEMKKIINSTGWWSGAESVVTYCFMIKSLERKLSREDLQGPCTVLPTFRSLGAAGLLPGWLPAIAFVTFLVFMYNFVKLRQKLPQLVKNK